MFVMRLNADGSKDNSFNGTGVRVVGFNLGGDNGDFGRALALQADGKILMGGQASGAGTSWPAMVRLTTTGALDATFDSDGKLLLGLTGASVVWQLVVRPDQRIAVIVQRQMGRPADGVRVL
jgi:uncharacterized delta-60 repeat protein